MSAKFKKIFPLPVAPENGLFVELILLFRVLFILLSSAFYAYFQNKIVDNQLIMHNSLIAYCNCSLGWNRGPHPGPLQRRGRCYEIGMSNLMLFITSRNDLRQYWGRAFDLWLPSSPLYVLSFFLAKKKGPKKNATFANRSARKRSLTAWFVETRYSNVRYRGITEFAFCPYLEALSEGGVCWLIVVYSQVEKTCCNLTQVEKTCANWGC